jgi:hypothetical protein
MTYPYEGLQSILDYSQLNQDWARWRYVQQLIATANGRYHIRHPNLNLAINQADGIDLRPLSFSEWLGQVWV